MARGGEATDPAYSRDLILDGSRRFDLRVTVAWVAGLGLSAWAYYGDEGMEAPKRVLARMLRANYEYALVKFALTDDDRPMLMVELPPDGLSQDALGRALTRLLVVADRLMDETAAAIADRGVLPDWTDRVGRNPGLLAAYRAEVESTMPPWEAPVAAPRRRGLLERVLGLNR